MSASPTEVQNLDLSTLEAHPWQLNVPNLTGKDWHVFYKDVGDRGIQEPVAVSTRTGSPVIVDGHQRVRAARELGLTHVPAIVREFADEAEEVTFLAGAARFRRHLNDAQRIDIGKAYETYFRPKAKGAQQAAGGDKKSGGAKESLYTNLDKAIDTTKEAADAVGLSRTQYAKGKQVDQKAPEPVKREWRQGNLSTHAAHELTRAPDPIRDAIHTGVISPQQGIAVQRDKKLSAQVAKGEVTVQEAVDFADVIKHQREEENRVMGRDLAISAHDDLVRITDRSIEEWLAALNTRMNLEQWRGTMIDDLRETIRHLQAVEKEATVYTLTVN